MAYDLETEPDRYKTLKCSECNNWKPCYEDELEHMQENEIPESDFVCEKCRKQAHLID